MEKTLRTSVLILLCAALVAAAAPAASAAPAAPAAPDAAMDATAGGKCVTAYEFADEGLTVCVRADPDCPVFVWRDTVWGGYGYCLPPQPATAEAAGEVAAVPEALEAPETPVTQCLMLYWDASVGPVDVVARDSCTNEVFVGGERVVYRRGATVEVTPGGEAAAQADDPPQCVHGGVTVTAGGYHVTLLPCGAGPVETNLDEAGAASAAGPQCMPVYREYHVGPVTVVQRSTCSYYVTYDEGYVEDTVDELTGSDESSGELPVDGCRRVLFLHWVDYSRHYACVDGDGDLGDGECTLAYKRDGIDGSTEACLTEPPASAAQGWPPCFSIYQEYEAGPVTVEMRSSCSAQVYVDGEPLLR